MPPFPPPDARTALPPATLAALQAVGVSPDDLAPLRPEEPRPDLQAAAEYAGLVASALTVPQAAARLGVDPSRIRQRLAARTVFGVRMDSAWRLLVFQFTDDGRRLVSGFSAIAPRLAGLHPLDVTTWFTAPNKDTVIDAVGNEEVAVFPSDWLLGGGDLRERFDHHLVPPQLPERSIVYVADAALTCFAEVFQAERRIDVVTDQPMLATFTLARNLPVLDLTELWLTRARRPLPRW